MEAPSNGIDNRMGLMASACYVIGNIVGSGIFITPTDVLRRSGSIGLALVMWLVCGIISLLGAVSFIELGTGIPTDGADFAYQTHVGWDAIAFSFMLITALLTLPASSAVQSTTFGYYMVKGLQQLFHIDESEIYALQLTLSISLLVLCTIINFYSVGRIGGIFQAIVTLAKALILIVVIGVGVYWMIFKESRVTPQDAFKGSDLSPANIVIAAYMGLWSFSGWDILNFGAPAIKNPSRNIPLALVGSLIVVTVIFVSTILSFSVVLGKDEMLNSTAVAADFATVSMGPIAWTVPFATAVLLIGSVNANIFCTARVILEAAKRGHLFSFLAAENKHHESPRAALIFQFLLSLGFTFIDVTTLINYVNFVFFGQKAFTMLALFYMRFRNTEMHEDVVRVPLVIHVTFFVICSALVAIPFITETKMAVIGLAAVGVSGLIYLLFVKLKISCRGFTLFNRFMLYLLKGVGCEPYDPSLDETLSLNEHGEYVASSPYR